jgi:NADP-dependent 3-hydroxy acid dehydrogenase YdfG
MLSSGGQVNGISMRGKTVLITGATSGLGPATYLKQISKERN